MSDFVVKITVRNARLLRAIRAKYGSASEMSRQTGIGTSVISGLLTMRMSPLANGDWSKSAFDVSSALLCEPEDLWPAHIAKMKLRRNEAEIEMSLEQVEGLLSAGDRPMAQAMLAKWAASANLTDRQADVLARRVSGATLEECSQVYGVNRERIRQIELKAASKIRRAAFSRGVRSIDDAVSS
jgi:DNA-binding CsgD family transcriptional regulator